MYNTLIDAQTLALHRAAPDWLVVDCQYDLTDKSAGYQRYLTEHVPGAVYADLQRDLSSPHPVTDRGRHPMPSVAQLERQLSALGVSNHKQVVAYDNAGGAFAARLWWLLNYAGHERVAVLDGGLQAWQQAGYATAATETQVTDGRFTATLNSGRLVQLQEVHAVPRLVDSREAPRYAGAAEPIDPVAGHIPGAWNRPWKDNLDAQGKFQSPQRLWQAFAGLYADVAALDVTFYCGSGVSACHNLLAAVHAGYPLPRLYAGSWSEWCADPARPVAVGCEPDTGANG
ncbi:MAG: sulfurtransferase [Gammaproteobacteria bacterium]|nr:sulfurtransferase [Gammaproteobacteria bacterium]MCY4282646.1 sulfurtransferase [Gammaproteobacteria bacterium]MCY4339381.1 sulfurtransferase [Gammaproteobacteria bacterium]